MAGELPDDFDPAWYASAYPDVGMSGLKPREHYLRFGRVLGRAYKGTPAPVPRAAEPARKTEDKPAKPATKRREEPPKAPPPRPKRQAGQKIIERPKGFDPAAAVPKPGTPPRSDGSRGPFSLEALAAPAQRNVEDAATIAPALAAYARLLNIKYENRGMDFGCGAAPFQSGGTRIENAWMAGPSTLRLMIAGGADCAGTSVRAYQANPASPAELHLIRPGVQLPPLGPVIHDLELRHSLMPLLLELADANGASSAFALLPFPSLIRGGLHGAELKALQTEPNPIDDLWVFSEALLQEAVGGHGWPKRSVTAIHGRGAAADPGVQEWLSVVFDLGNPAEAKPGPELVLPPNSVPTISALVSRRLKGDGATLSGPYLVAEAGSHRPLWSIALPADGEVGSSIPLLRPNGANTALPSELAPFPLAIVLRPPTPAPNAATANGAAATSNALSIVVDAADADRVGQMIQSLRNAVNGDTEWLVRLNGPETELSEVLDRACGEGAWAAISPRADLRAVARDARHETVLTVSDRAQLHDTDAVGVILDLLQRNETTGSASCALLAEKIIKKAVVLQPASGGLFPTGVSLASGPRLAFGEPDALQALPDLAYPVVANTLHLTAWRRRALSELSAVYSTGSASSQDLRLGLDLMRTGYRNWCTTRATARLSGTYVRRDAIDPVGAGYLQPERWEEILAKVAIVRELH